MAMSPRPAPDLDDRRDQIVRAAGRVAESEGWTAVTMRRLASEIGVTQPVIYSAFPQGRQAVVDAVALGGFEAIARALEAVDAEPLARMRAYLEFAAGRPAVYEAMFSMPTGLTFGVEAGGGPMGARDAAAGTATDGGPGAEAGADPLHRAFAAIQEAFPGPDDVRAEIAWASLHGLATLQISGRLPASRSDARLEHLHRVLTR
jgi:AcrR family transcriptional regulator